MKRKLTTIRIWLGLLAAWLCTSAFQVPCIFFCTDQTLTQANYVSARDRCREAAELKAPLYAGEEGGDAQQQARLVTLFSECMKGEGWTVPGPGDGKDKDKEKEAHRDGAQKEAAVAAAPVMASAASIEAGRKRDVQRAAECAYARHAAANSSIAANKAKACDYECADRLAHAPDAPRPAACPPESEEHTRPVPAELTPLRLPPNPELQDPKPAPVRPAPARPAPAAKPPAPRQAEKPAPLKPGSAQQEVLERGLY